MTPKKEAETSAAEMGNSSEKGIIAIPSSLHALAHVVAVAHSLSEKGFFILDGDPLGDIIVLVRPKVGIDSTQLKSEFAAILESYTQAKQEEEKDRESRDGLLLEAIRAGRNVTQSGFINEGFEALESQLKELEIDSVSDPLGILESWRDTEEKARQKEGQR